jgi:gamma-D-glutamyl-L-lysine dipeptidyl-peptidase
MNFIDRGICRLSLVSIRGQSSDKSEMVSQLIFGEHYGVLEVSPDKKWLKILTSFDEYMGWIDVKQHTSISEEYFNQLSNTDYKITLDLVSTILFKKQLLHITIGSMLPIGSNELFQSDETFAFNGEAKSVYQRRDFEFMKAIAKKYIHTPYLWGGKSPFGIDCSGFTQQVFKICGFQLKRDAWQQAQQGQAVIDFSSALPGDLVFFGEDPNKISHVGLLLEDQQIIHASGQVRIDQIDEIGIFNDVMKKYSHKLLSIRRVIKRE